MTSKSLLVSLLILFSGIVFSDSIPEKSNDSNFLFKSHKTQPTPEELKESFNNSSKINLWKFFWRILFIFTLLVGVIFAISKYSNKSLFIGKNTQGNSQFQILFQYYLSSKQKIILVKSFNKYLLLGLTDQSINLLKEFEESEIDEDSLQQSNSQSFINNLLRR